MEIKVQCECGARYKFEIEPVHGRMPTPVKCPDCGADGTIEANRQIQQALSGAPAAPVPVAGNAPAAPVATAMPPPPPPSASPAASPPPASPGGLRVAKPAVPPPIIPIPSGATYLSAPPLPPGPGGRKRGVWPRILISVAIVFCVCGGGAFYVIKKAIPKFAEFAKEMDGGSAYEGNLEFGECSILYVRHTNDLIVAESCQEFWRTNLQRNLTISALTNVEVIGEEVVQKRYLLHPAYNGYIEIVGDQDWPLREFERLALHLSKQLDTLVFEARDMDDSGTYHFGVYEQGARKFHAQWEVSPLSSQDPVVTEGNEWALNNGYRPGSRGFKDFDLDDAEALTRRFGMKMWDEDLELSTRYYIMSERP